MSAQKMVLSMLVVFLAGGMCMGQVPPEADDNNEEAYKPYSPDEFPTWLHQIRRAEIVLIGSFPITMLFTTLSYEGFRAAKSALEQDTATGSTAIEFGSFTTDEKKGLLLGGLILSLIVSVIDLVIDRANANTSE